MILNELREKRNKAMADASTIMQGDVTAEKRTQFDALLADVTVIDGDISRLESVEQYKAEQRAIVPARPNPGESNDPDERVEVRDARQKKALRSYMQGKPYESRDLTVSAEGSIAIPVGFSPQLIEAQKSYGDLYNIVTVVKTDHGNPLKIVLDDDTANGLSAVTVGTNVSEVDPTLTGKTLQVDTFSTGSVVIDNGLLSDAGWDIESWLRDRFGARFYRGASNLIFNGDSGAVASLASGYTAGFTTAVSNKLGYADFATSIGTLDPAYQANAIWGMSNATLAVVIGLQDANSRPLFLPFNDGGAGGFVGTILGKPVRIITQMPAVATGNVAMLFGDFKAGYTFRQQNPGLAIIRQNELYSAGFATGFVGFARVGGVVTQASSSVPPMIAATIK